MKINSSFIVSIYIIGILISIMSLANPLLLKGNISTQPLFQKSTKYDIKGRAPYLLDPANETRIDIIAHADKLPADFNINIVSDDERAFPSTARSEINPSELNSGNDIVYSRLFKVSWQFVPNWAIVNPAWMEKISFQVRLVNNQTDSVKIPVGLPYSTKIFNWAFGGLGGFILLSVFNLVQKQFNFSLKDILFK